jgi:hypothetical protein
MSGLGLECFKSSFDLRTSILYIHLKNDMQIENGHAAIEMRWRRPR